MKNLIRKILKEENELGWVQDVPNYFNDEVYNLLEKGVELTEHEIHDTFLTGETMKFQNINIKYSDGYVEKINITFRNKKYVLNSLMDFIYTELPNVDERTAIKTTRIFMNEKIYN